MVLSMNIYISGPMRGVYNYREKFNRAEEFMKKYGFRVINPANFKFSGMSREQILDIDLSLLGTCNAIYMLKGWKESCGANREYGYAVAKKMLILYEEDD